MRRSGRSAFWALLLTILTAPARAEHWALLVAAPTCADERWPELRFAEQDIARLGELLGGCGYAGARSGENIVRLSPAEARRDEDLSPTRENLLERCRRIGRRAKVDDTILIALSGHGVEALAGGRQQPCFCPADGSPGDVKSLASLSEIISVVEENTRAKRIVLLVDACRTWPKGAKRAADSDATGPLELPDRWCVFWSCSAGQSAYEDPRVQHGVFPHFVIEGLRGSSDANDDGRVTVAELASFVGERTGKHVRDRLKKEQTPEFLGEGGDAVIATYREP